MCFEGFLVRIANPEIQSWSLQIIRCIMCFEYFLLRITSPGIQSFSLQTVRHTV